MYTRALRLIACLVATAAVTASCAKSAPPSTPGCTIGEIRCATDGAAEEVCSNTNGALRWERKVCAGGARCDAKQQRCIDLCGACDTPPTKCHKDKGTCWNGKCQYELADGKACDDGDACTENDFCRAGSCQAGKSKVCDQIPADKCVNANRLQAYAQSGVCKSGQCTYPSATVDCPLGCESGKCKGDPCQGIKCDRPPGGCYQAVGICSGGVCTYLPDDGKKCDDGDSCTENDACATGKCAGTPKKCDSPPKNSCKDASTLTSWAAQGTCKSGKCEYTKSEVPCGHGCDAAAGACKGDPCKSVVCNKPPNGCYKAQGTCSQGSCSYAYDNGKSCDDSDACTENDKCSVGVCRGSKVVCNTPPANACKDANTLTVYTAPGACNQQGKCDYSSADVSCPFGCDSSSGACKGDPCANVTCNSPPNTQCYTTPGICSGGNCTYLPRSGATCDDGDPCTRDDVCNSSGACAGTAYTCDDGLVCTNNTCDGQGGCTYPLSAGSCLMKINLVQTCFQTGDKKSGNACQHCDPSQFSDRWSVSTGTTLQSWNFDDNTLQGWTVVPNPDNPSSPVTWQVDSQRAAAGSHSVYFGDPTTRTYDDPSKRVQATLVSPSISAPTGQGKLCLQLAFFKDTEKTSSWDLLTLTLVDGATKTVVWTSNNEVDRGDTSGAFVTISADISAAAGKTVTVELHFDSKDSLLNRDEGVYVDEIKLLSNCTP